MSYPSDTFSTEMASFTISGNTIDHTWSKFILRENGYVDPVAKDMLGEIVYWYRPKIERSLETDEIIIQKKYKADLLQLSYAQFETRLGYTKRQLEEGFKTLERIGVAERVLRTIMINGQKIANVLFVRLNHKKLTELREEELKKCDTSHVKTGHPPRQNVIPVTPKRETNTESIPDFTLEKTTTTKEPVVVVPSHTKETIQLLKDMGLHESCYETIINLNESLESVKTAIDYARLKDRDNFEGFVIDAIKHKWQPPKAAEPEQIKTVREKDELAKKKSSRSLKAAELLKKFPGKFEIRGDRIDAFTTKGIHPIGFCDDEIEKYFEYLEKK